MYHGERLNAWTHLVGAVLAVIGASWLVLLASVDGDPMKLTSAIVYGSCMVLLYCSSTLYHSLRGKAKVIMRKLDHLSIYLMIAGSYTPFCLVVLRGAWGWSLLGTVWGLALLGMLLEIRPRSEARVLSVVLYAVMGWLVVIALDPLLKSLGTMGFACLALGGLVYTVGILFYCYDNRYPHWHGIWHLFVLAGSLLHFIAIWLFVF
ncbi:PAQR family membrane homeostasis protein TrhA [Stutzerimonas tarimensis]|uniref:Hemolysin III family protein n=1 Tax=Stutzerimonas tarimensis TaxID=1507735 RepID=A0ABV7T0W2_9GAMM